MNHKLDRQEEKNGSNQSNLHEAHVPKVRGLSTSAQCWSFLTDRETSVQVVPT